MTPEDILGFYRTASDDELYAKADQVCRENYKGKVYLRGLIEFSNYCSQDCLYCGIRRSNAGVNRYRLTEEEILESVEEGYNRDFRTFVLQSGEDPYFTTERLCRLIGRIKSINDDIAVTLSAGIRSRQSYSDLKQSGCDRYLIRFETSDPGLHRYLRGGITLSRRMRALSDLRELGFEVGSGFMVGLPGETEEIREKNALLCHEYGFNMVGIGPFIPHPDTPLAGSQQQPVELALRAVALVRLLLPGANLPATTAAGTLDPDGREKMLSAGANVLMPNITPVRFKKDYLLYPNKICIEESGFECVGCLSGRAAAIDKQLSFERGDSVSYLKLQNAIST